MAMRQRWRLAEIRAEDYAFVLFSSFLNQLNDKVYALFAVLAFLALGTLPLHARYQSEGEVVLPLFLMCVDM